MKYISLFGGATIALVSLMTLPATSQAQDIEFRIGRDGPRFERDDYERRDYGRRDRRSKCSVGEAVGKAHQYLSRPRIDSVDRRYVVVTGYGRHGEFNRVVFWNDYGCPRADK